MSDHRAILAAYDHARANGLPAVLATVVAARGSTYRKPGARMILVGDGTRVGVVSGGCLEADVARRAWFLKNPGEAERVRYDTGNGDDATYEFGLGCRGVVDVLLERLDTSGDAPTIIGALRAAADARVTTTFRTTTRGPDAGERVAIGSTGRRPECRLAAPDGSDTFADTFVEVIAPPVQIVIFGSGVDVVPVARVARAVGWRVVIVDGRPRPAHAIDADATIVAPPGDWALRVTPDARSAAVLMTHRMDDDAGYLADAVRLPFAYVGCLGPLSRTEALLDRLALCGIALADDRRRAIHAPVGLDLGGDGPEAIALAIVAEVQATLHDASCASLRDRGGAIHATPVDGLIASPIA